MRIKSPFITFVVIISLLVGSAIMFIQSRGFAGIFKQVVFKYLPRDTGIEADFSEFAIKVFPPGFSLKDPVITLRDRNILKMPGGSSVKAERIDFEFQPFQMLTGDIRVKELTLVNGNLQLFYEPPKGAPVSGKSALPSRSSLAERSLSFHWDELLQVHAEAVGMQNMKVRVDWIGTTDYAELQVGRIRLAQWQGTGGLGYEIGADISSISGSFIRQFPAIRALDGVALNAYVNETGAVLENFAVRGTGISLNAQGAIHGNIQKPKNDLGFDADLKMSGDLARVAHEIFPSLDIQGAFDFDGKAHGNLQKFLETLKLEGKFAATDLRYRHFLTDKAQAEGSWAAAPGGGELVIKQALLSAAERPRTAALPAAGGKIKLGDIHYRIGSHDPVNLHLELERTSLQWLGSLALEHLKQIYPVQALLTGTVDGTIHPASLTPGLAGPGGRPVNGQLEFQATAKIKAEKFQLDNQKMGVPRPLVRVFAAPEIAVEGPVHFDASGLHFDEVQVQLPRSKLVVTGSIAPKTGFDLHGAGAVNLEDLGKIAENEVRGMGSLQVNVSGPPQRILVDVDADLIEAYYLHMQFGAVKGRITWDDDPNHLIFQNVQGVRGESHYFVNGLINTGEPDSVAITANIPRGTIQDFIVVFHDLTEDLSWFPVSLTGPLSGSIDISGGLKIPKLKVLAKVAGTSWSYLGERFAKVSLQGGLDQGAYLLSSFSAVKRSGTVSGRISYSTDNVMDWDVHTRSMMVSDIDHIARLDVPIRGALSIDSSGKGKEGAVVSQTQVNISGVSVRSVDLPPSQLNVSTASGVMTIHGNGLGGQGTLYAKYDFNPTNASLIKADFHRLDFSPVLLLLNPRLITDTALAGYASGAVNLSFRSGQMDRGTGNLSLSEYLLCKQGTRFTLAHPVSLPVKDGSFDLPSFAIASDRGQAELSLKSRQAKLDGTISGDLDLSLLEFFTSAISRASGVAKLDLQVGGTLRAPTVSGSVSPSSPTIWVDGLDSPFENVTGDLELKENVLEVSGLEADLASGRVSGNGKITLFADHAPVLDLHAEINNSKVKVYPFQSLKMGGTLVVVGDEVPYLVEGDILIDSALSKEKILQASQSTALKAAQYTPPAGTLKTGDYPLFKLKINVRADRNIMVQNELFDAELKARLTVLNTIEAPRLLGNVDLVQGKMMFKGHDFQIQSMGVNFDNPAVLNPKVNLTAGTEVSGVKVQLDATGTVDDTKNLRVELTSTPAMSESDILSLLTIGMTTSDTKRLSASDLAAVQQGEAASLLLNSLDFNREIADKTGIQLQLDESINNYQGASVFNKQTAGETSVAPKIVVRKQLTRDVDVSYGSTVGAGSGSEQTVNLEYKMTPGASLIGVYDNYESLDTGDRETSYGLDFKLQKRFR
jgi:autotransporter translocation and assembly factor TamB